MNMLTAKSVLIEEYDFFKKSDINIIKQFVSPDGRVSNTFLVKSNKKGFEKFVAKSFVHNTESLEREWIVLNLLKNHVDIAPRVLLPTHKPKKFLLIQFVEGITATEYLTTSIRISDIFEKIGKATGIVNSIRLQKVGNILEIENISWKEYITRKLQKNLTAVEPIIDNEFLREVKLFIKEKEYILDEETKKEPRLVHHDIYLDNFLINTQKMRYY